MPSLHIIPHNKEELSFIDLLLDETSSLTDDITLNLPDSCVEVTLFTDIGSTIFKERARQLNVSITEINSRHFIISI